MFILTAAVKKQQHKSTAQLVTGSSLTVNQHAILEFSQDTHEGRTPSLVQIQQSKVESQEVNPFGTAIKPCIS